MRTIFLSLLLAANSFVMVGQQSSDPYSIEITLRHSGFKIGMPITIFVKVKNTSTEDVVLKIFNGEPERSFVVSLRNEKGQTPAETMYNKRLKGMPVAPGSPDSSINQRVPYSFRLIKVRPGESFEQQCSITKLYDIDQPGTYKVVFEMVDDATKKRVVSNLLSFSALKE